MEDETEKISIEEGVYKPEIVECGTCGYHYQKAKKCPQCSMKEDS